MNTNAHAITIARSLAMLFRGGLFLSLFAISLFAQAPATGTLQGRIYDAGQANERYMENAKVTLVETGRQTFTDAEGWYRFINVPTGNVTIEVTFTGMQTNRGTVAVTPGGITQFNLGLMAYGIKAEKKDDVIVLDSFTVSESKEMGNALIAINEERYSPNLKTIIGTDEFGTMPSDDVGELMKMMPGLAMTMTDGEPTSPNINGIGADYVPVTVGGFSMSSAAQGSTGRETRLTHVSLNNFSRIEIVRSPTPESPGNALAGTANLVPRSAFERKRPVLNFSTYISMRADETDLGATAGPRFDRRKWQPGFDFSYVVPVNSRFGFSVSGNLSGSYKRRDYVQNTWRGTYSTTNGNAYPHTTADNPYLSAWTVRDGVLFAQRKSLAATFDYKLTSFDVLSFTVNHSVRNSQYDNRALAFSMAGVTAGDFSSRYTHSTSKTSTLQVSLEDKDYDNKTFMPTLTYRHNGPLWKIDAGASYSTSTALTRAPDMGFMSTTTMKRNNVIVNFDDVGELGPKTVRVQDAATGTVIDPFDVNNYALTNATWYRELTTDVKQTGFANFSRMIESMPIPFIVKAGMRVDYSKRNICYADDYSNSASFVGADGAGSTSLAGDDDAGQWAWPEVTGRLGAFGWPAVPTVNVYKVYGLSQSNPTYFKETELSRYNRVTDKSMIAREIISAGYVQADARLFKNRLWLIGGVRGEQTDIWGAAAKEDPTANYERDSSGNIVRDAKGAPKLIYASGSIEERRLVYTKRGAEVRKDYTKYFPSINGVFNITSNLQLHAAWFTSIGRPTYNRYIDTIEVPDLQENPSSSNRFTLANPGIKPWSARTTSVSLEYYFQKSGKISVSAFRRDITDFFGSKVMPMTQELLDTYGLGNETSYLAYDVSTQYNVPGTVRMEGATVAYKQGLSFLDHWVRGLSAYASFSMQNNKNDEEEEFAIIPRYGSGGVSINRRNWSANLNYTWRDDQFQSTKTGTGIPDGTEYYVAAYGSLDLTMSFRLTKNFQFVAKMTNLLDEDHKLMYANGSTPTWARTRQFDAYGGGIWTFSIQGTF